MSSEFRPNMHGLAICIDILVADESGKQHSREQKFGTLVREGSDGRIYWVAKDKPAEEPVPFEKHVRHALKGLAPERIGADKPPLTVPVRGTYFESMSGRGTVSHG